MLRTRRARLSMTSLIDVIFLLLLFFMLTSTFSRFGEIPIALGGAGGGTGVDADQVFVRLSAAGATVNGRGVEADALVDAVTQFGEAPQVLLTTTEDANAQALADALHLLRGIQDAQIVVLR
ncbi:MAG: biopolymer transporter ExbD [Pseudomonadota bacterium]